MKVFLALVALALFNSCGSWEDPQLISYDGLSKFSIKEKVLKVSLNGIVENPNSKTIYIYNLDHQLRVKRDRLKASLISLLNLETLMF